MEIEPVATLLSLLAAPRAAGAAYGGVRAGLNGARQSIQSIDRICNRLDEKVDEHGQRITKTEVEIINLKERSGNG